MNKHILLITNSPDELWVELMHTIIKADDSTLTVVESDCITRAMSNQFFDITIVDSATVPETAETVAELRALPATQHIVVLTTVPGWRQARDMFHAGADDYRFKSYDEEDLREIVKIAEKIRVKDKDAGARPAAASPDYC